VVVDLFAGGGGASHGIRSALGVEPVLAVNHCPAAVEMHAANHPNTIHMTEDLYRVLPFNPGGMPIDLLHGSPDCTFFSRAKGSKPLNNKRRMLAWVVLEWARATHPGVITLENVPEFIAWGPLHSMDHPNPKLRGRPIKEREGETFREFVNGLKLAGYQVEWRVLNACDYGAPTARKRLFIAARRDGKPITWPKPTHGPGRPLPYRTAAECIDWSIPMLSIFATKAEAKAFAKKHKVGVPHRPLADATMRRIAEGVRRYVLNSPRPYIVQFSHQGSGDGSKVRPVDAPLSTIVTKAEHCLVVPTLVQTGYGEREGQAPRVLDINAPVGTIVAGGGKHALVAAFLAKHNGSGETWNAAIGQPLDTPTHTITGTDTKALIVASFTKFYGTSTGCSVDQPAPTILSGGEKGGHHIGLVAALMTKFYGTGGQLQPVDVPLHTIPTVDRFGLVTVDIDGDTYAIVDIKMRMLDPRELALMQGFPPDYILTGSRREQVARIGNSVSPPPMQALIAELFKDVPREEVRPRRRRAA
jgi:DNA (cytosine-5)-methyltransferase 1